MGLLLLTCGLVLAGTGIWSGYRNAREAIVPASNTGDPTRAAIEASRPWPMRRRVREFVRNVAVSIGWIVLAMYGLFLISAAGTAGS